MELTDLPNVGPVLAGNLQAIGVMTPEELRRLGAEEFWLRIRPEGRQRRLPSPASGSGGRCGQSSQEGAVPGAEGELKAFVDSHK
jgi:hypothetical protein